MRFGDWADDLIVGVLTGGVYNIAKEVEAATKTPTVFDPELGFSLKKCLKVAVDSIRTGTLKDLKGAVRRYWGEAVSLSGVPLSIRDKEGNVYGRYPAIDPPKAYQNFALSLLLRAFAGDTARQQAIAEYWTLFDTDRVPTVSAKSRKYQDVMLQGVVGSDHAGNAYNCTEYDFTSEDIYGALMGWWRLNRPKVQGVFVNGRDHVSGLAAVDPRMDYCGPGNNSAFIGDEPLLVDGKEVIIDGGKLYASTRDSGPYLVGGPSFCRYNPKNWVQEQFNELCFLLALSIFADKTVQAYEANDPNAGEAFMQTVALQHNFIMSKAGAKRDQWVTPVEGFHDTGLRFNDRREYIIGKWRGGSSWLVAAPQGYYYVPKTPTGGAGLERVLKTKEGGWRWGLPGIFVGNQIGLSGTYAMGNRPRNLVEPSADFMCEATATMKVITMVVKAAMTIMQVAGGSDFSWLGGSFPTSNKGGAAAIDAKKGQAFIERIAKWVTNEATESVKAGELDITFADVDFTGAAKAAGAIDAIGTTFTESFRPCVMVSEWKIWHGDQPDRAYANMWLPPSEKLKLETARLWRDAAKAALKEASKVDIDQEVAPTTTPTTTTTPGTTPVVAPAPGGGGLLPLLMGAGAGFLVGGPIGAGVGAVVAAAASGGSTASQPAKPSEPAVVVSGRWTLKDSTGIVQLQQSGTTVTGGIAWSAGRGVSLRGTRTGNTLEGAWADVNNQSNAGRFKIIFSGNTFTGTWGTGAASQGGGVWTGQRG